MNALGIITDAYERLNRLSPGEALSADDAAFGLRRLNVLVDEMSAKRQFLQRDVLTVGTQTGHITLGAGDWAGIAPGSKIISASAGKWALTPITVQQYNQSYPYAITGLPLVYAEDGLLTVYLYPIPAAEVMMLQTRVGVAAFADFTTDYTMAPGYQAALGASLAVRLAPSLLGDVPGYLLRAERLAMAGVTRYEPAILNTANHYSARPHWGWGGLLGGSSGGSVVTPPTTGSSVYADNYATDYA